MQKTYCDRCGRAIPDVRDAHSLSYSQPRTAEGLHPMEYLVPKMIELCPACGDDFNAFMKEMPLQEEAHAKEPTGSP